VTLVDGCSIAERNARTGVHRCSKRYVFSYRVRWNLIQSRCQTVPHCGPLEGKISLANCCLLCSRYRPWVLDMNTLGAQNPISGSTRTVRRTENF